MEYKGTDRRRTDRRADSREEWERRWEGLLERVFATEQTVAKLEVAIWPRIEKIDEMHSDFTALKGGFTVLTWIGKAAKPVFLIVAVAVAIKVGLSTGVWKFP